MKLWGCGRLEKEVGIGIFFEEFKCLYYFVLCYGVGFLFLFAFVFYFIVVGWFNGIRYWDGIWSVKCLLGINVCGRWGEKIKLGRVWSWIVM